MNQSVTIVAAVNDDMILRRNLLLSPRLQNGNRDQLIIKRGFKSASLAYNSALDEAEHDLVLFVHQDVYLPEGWFDDLERCLTFLKETGAPWGILGCFGSRRAAPGGLGRLYTTGLGRLGRWLTQPEPVETLDEAILVMRKSSGLRFDERLPHFHLYGADICLAARAKGLTSYAFQGFLVHNTNQLMSLPAEFYDCYRYIKRKWSRFLPIYTACVTITRLNVECYRKRLADGTRLTLGLLGEGARRAEDPRIICNADASTADM
jgi:hypothetical protein